MSQTTAAAKWMAPGSFAQFYHSAWQFSIQVTGLLREVLLSAAHISQTSRQAVKASLDAVHSQARMQANTALQRSGEAIGEVISFARAAPTLARAESESLMREISGQGPDRTLKRGFALIRVNGQVVSRASDVSTGSAVMIEFADGNLPAHIDKG